MFPEAITLPAVRGGATDNAQLRARGVQAYGFGPITDQKESHGAHTEDERLREDSIPKLMEFLWRGD
jgi:acetylornithine deacetylase/succinyl-diaminopimelate desuccinylase-like protein